ncbi:MAG: DUF1657 domain-containing protein [bacterium]
MTTYHQVNSLLAILKNIKADLKTLALTNTGDAAADAVILQAALAINKIITDIDNRKKEMEGEEPQFSSMQLPPVQEAE